MSVKIFRDNNWNRITNGVISRRDIMHLNGIKDRELIGFLIRHASSECGRSVEKYVKEKYGIDEMPELPVNIDDPDDPYYEAYFVLREQAGREDDIDVLKEAVLHSSDYDMAAFAFCRLTGYSFPADNCDAYSYRTFSCDVMPGMTAERIREFCEMLIRKGDRFKDVAEEYLRSQKTDDQ